MTHRYINPHLIWLVYDETEENIAAFSHAEDAAAFIAIIGEGNFICTRNNKKVLWQEGAECFSAATLGYDEVGKILRERAAKLLRKKRKKPPTSSKKIRSINTASTLHKHEKNLSVNQLSKSMVESIKRARAEPLESCSDKLDWE